MKGRRSRAASLLGATLLLAWTLLGAASPAAADVAVPPLTARVTDLTGTLTADQIETLEQTLQALEASKGSQLAVLIVPTTAPETIEQYGIRVAEQWKLGRKNVDDGAILLVAKNDRQARIEVGYGLEGALNDATCERIVSEIIAPRFQRGDFYGGISAGLDRMIRVVDGEPLPAPAPAPRRRGGRSLGPIFLLAVLVLGGLTRSTLGKFPGAIVTGGVLGFLAWLFVGAAAIAVGAGLIGFLFTLLGGGMAGPLMMGGMGGGFRGGFGGGFGGFGGGFGGGGGGFSGGGGGFGGGGASGSW